MNSSFPRTTLAILLACCFSAATTPAVAETVSLTASRDASIYESMTGNRANGAGQRLFSGLSGVGLRRALVGFDVAEAIPAGATIDSAEVRFVIDRDSPASPTAEFGLHRLLMEWQEGPAAAGITGGQGATSQPGDVTWIHASHNDQLWSSPGGDFSSEASSSLAFTNVAPVVFPSTEQLVADVQTWLNDPASNFGWVLLGGEATAVSARRLHSRESTSAGSRPTLTIEYTLTELFPGDINGDAKIDLADFNILKAHFNQSPAVRGEGDLNEDGRVDLADFNILKANFNTGAAVPEPSAVALAALAAAGLVGIRRAKKQAA